MLCFFARSVLDPTGALREHSKCIQLFGDILSLLKMGDRVVQFTNRLRQLFVEHHQLMLLLYSSDVVKVKSHMQHHLPQCIDDHKVLLDTFSCERRNRLLKAAVTNTSHAHRADTTILSRLLLDMIDHVERAECQPFTLRGAGKAVDCAIVSGFLAGTILKTTGGKSISSPFGGIRGGTFVELRDGQVRMLAKCDHFLDVRFVERPFMPNIYVHATMFSAPTTPGGSVWMPSGDSVYFEAASIHDVLTVIRDGVGVQPFWRPV